MTTSSRVRQEALFSLPLGGCSWLTHPTTACFGEQASCVFLHKKIYQVWNRHPACFPIKRFIWCRAECTIDSEALYIGSNQQRRNTKSILGTDLYYTTRYYQQQLK
ncbi:hypothetical protein IQ270_22955 [Microcoleus sp. LEGE 07076]|uniref:hypothetical protein n=1 Tax=Microcoleus sp. LEGE 07076 TaxID=915322 RepID=UPI00187FBA04|nr:hypothetical protein [Microcoleus sp. LEGE 07076]MBE9187432.1 hypothetical protein [Microcoleus sp. LEGE 07076]